MKKYLVISFASIAIFLNSCTIGQTQTAETKLPATEFAEKIKELPTAPLVDVRTPGEFAKGHLSNAQNIDWTGNDFDNQINKLDKSKPVFVYCLSGGRSSAAAVKMRSTGFKEVYELNGGMMKWRSANLPETTSITNSSPGLTQQQFGKLLDSDKMVLIDFYADWCIPCVKMKPYLDHISKDMASKVVVIRINADDNKALCEKLKIETLPVLQVYKNKRLTWTREGYLDKEDIVKVLKAN